MIPPALRATARGSGTYDAAGAAGRVTAGAPVVCHCLVIGSCFEAQMKASWFIGSFVLAVGAAIGVKLGLKPDAIVAQAVPPTDAPFSTPHRVRSAESSSDIRHEDEARSPVPRLGSMIDKTTDLRSFALTAIEHPELGGTYFAGWVVDRCFGGGAPLREIFANRAADQLREAATVDPVRLQAQDVLLWQCRSLGRPEAERLASRARWAQPDARDPLAVARRALVSGYLDADTGRIGTAFGQLLALDASFVLSEPTVAQMVGSGSVRRSGERWFEGRRISDSGTPLRTAQYDMAFALATCDDGGACGFDQRMVSECAFQGFCADDRRGYIARLNRWAGGNSADVKWILELSSRMHAAMIERNVDAFGGR